MLRWDYGDRLEVRDEVPLEEMPPRLDLLLLRRDPQVALPFPLDRLGRTTLAEFKGPDDEADQKALVKLLGDTLAFQRREQWWEREELTLWLIASSFTADVSRTGGGRGPGTTCGGSGSAARDRGWVPDLPDGFPICLMGSRSA